jgi:hypothetical protein
MAADHRGRHPVGQRAMPSPNSSRAVVDVDLDDLVAVEPPHGFRRD